LESFGFELFGVTSKLMENKGFWDDIIRIWEKNSSNNLLVFTVKI